MDSINDIVKRGGGFTGSHFVNTLLARGDCVRVPDTFAPPVGAVT